MRWPVHLMIMTDFLEAVGYFDACFLRGLAQQFSELVGVLLIEVSYEQIP